MDDQQNDKILASNGLYYVMPKPLSTTLNRTYKTQYSTRTEYSPGDTMVFDINTSAVVDPELSFMKISVQALLKDIAIGSGSIVNCFREIRIQSRNGTELDRIEHLNDFSHYYMNNCVSKDIMASKGQSWGYGVNAVLTQNVVYDYCIPLSMLSGLFRPHVKGQKMPPQLLSGSRVEINLEAAVKAFYSVPAGVFDYKVLKPELHLMEMTQNDNTLKIITEQSANNGLEYFYPRVFTSVETSASSTVNYQIKKAVSQATHVVTCPKITSLAVNSILDSFVSVPAANYSKHQYRLGSNYYPNQICTSVVEAFTMSSQVCITMDDKIAPACTFDSFLNSGDLNVSTALKTDSMISASGLAVNNTATIALEYESVGGVELSFYTFLVYNALARCFLSQVTVKI